jgi:hypothetical protein
MISLAALVAVATFVRLALTPLYAHLPNHYTDEMFWKQWMLAIHEHGVLNIFRSTETDYVGYQWVLWLLALAYDAIGGPYTATTPSLHVLVKLPAILFDAALMVAVYCATLALIDSLATPEGVGADESGPPPGEAHSPRAHRLALTAAAVCAFEPAIAYDSAVWAQVDSAVALAMLVSLVLVCRGRPALAWAIWTAGFLVKPHPVIIVPVLMVLTLRCGWRAVPRSATAAAGVLAVVLGPWILRGDGMRIVTVYKHLFDADYSRLSALAWNLWWFRDVAAHPAPDTAMLGGVRLLTYRLAGLALSAAAGLIAVGFVAMSPTLKRALIAAAYLSLAFYVLPISTHERYLYPFFALLVPVIMVERRWLWWFVPASVTFFLNLVVVAPPIEGLSDRWIESPFSLAIAAVNVTLCASMSAYLLALELPDIARLHRPASGDTRAPAREPEPERATARGRP